MEFVKIKETCLYLHDLEAAHHFYHDVLELPVISYVRDKHIFFRVGASVLLCFNPDDSKSKTSPPAHFGGGQQHFAFEVASHEYAASKSWIVNKGIKITDEVTWSNGSKSFYFNDPAGNVLEIVTKEVWD